MEILLAAIPLAVGAIWIARRKKKKAQERAERRARRQERRARRQARREARREEEALEAKYFAAWHRSNDVDVLRDYAREDYKDAQLRLLFRFGSKLTKEETTEYLLWSDEGDVRDYLARCVRVGLLTEEQAATEFRWFRLASQEEAEKYLPMNRLDADYDDLVARCWTADDESRHGSTPREPPMRGILDAFGFRMKTLRLLELEKKVEKAKEMVDHARVYESEEALKEAEEALEWAEKEAKEEALDAERQDRDWV